MAADWSVSKSLLLFPKSISPTLNAKLAVVNPPPKKLSGRLKLKSKLLFKFVLSEVTPEIVLFKYVLYPPPKLIDVDKFL